MYLIFIVILALISAYIQFYTLSWLVSHVFAFHLYVTVISSSLAQVFPSGSIKFCFILSVGDYLLLLLLFLQRYKHTNIKKKAFTHFQITGKNYEKKKSETMKSIYLYFYIQLLHVCLQPQVGVLDSSLVPGGFTIRPVFSEPSAVNCDFSACSSSHTSRSGANTERTADPLHFLVAQLQSPIPQEVLGCGPTVSRDTELFHTWMVWSHVALSANLSTASVWVYF